MKLLWINCCLRDKSISRTYKLSMEYLDRIKQEKDLEIDEINLGDARLLPYKGEDIEKRDRLLNSQSYLDPMFDFADRFRRADYILISAPYWDLSFPSVLKVFFEHISVCGITFCYDQNGMPKGLCKGKKLTYITTCGGYIGSFNLGYDYIKGMCRLFGIDKTIEYTLEGLDIEGSNVKVCLDNCKIIQ